MNSQASQPTYPLPGCPEPGQYLEVCPGVLWLRMPLPFLLGHINLWLLADGDGWSIVDTGLGTQTTRDHWTDVLERLGGPDSVRRIVVTHLHPDHVGCTGWLSRICEAPLWMSREEYLLCRVLAADTGKPAPPEGLSFYAAAGFPDGALDRYQKTFGAFGRVVSPLPESYHRLVDGMVLEIGAHRWEVLIGRGHSVEHACLYCQALNVLISGDQILPTISSNVSVYPTEPMANPLNDWILSLQSLGRRLPSDVLVLPAHGKPFLGAHDRLGNLIQEHFDSLEALRALSREPVRAVDTFETLFAREIDGNNLILAAGEAVAHLNYLVYAGEVRTWRDDTGCRWYQMAG